MATAANSGGRGPLARLGIVGQRRLIFLLLGVVVTGTLLLPLKTPDMRIDRMTQDLFDAIDELQPGEAVLVSFDFDPSSKPELDPAARAILRHIFRRRARVITLGLWQTGIALAHEIIESEARLAHQRYGDPDAEDIYPVYGEDYVFLGWQPGMFAVIVALTEGIQSTFPQEYRGRRSEELPIWTDREGRTVRTLADLSLMVTISAGNPGIDEWIRYGRGKQQFRIGTAVTAVTAPGRMTFYKSGQIVGLLNGMRGAAEYEYLVTTTEDEERHGTPPPPLRGALAGMYALSASHFLVIGLVALSNLLYFLSRRRSRRGGPG